MPFRRKPWRKENLACMPFVFQNKTTKTQRALRNTEKEEKKNISLMPFVFQNKTTETQRALRNT